VKAAYLRSLIDGGFQAYRCGEFCVAKGGAADGGLGEVLQMLSSHPDVETIGIVVNARGAERAIATGR
jgi:hydroxymethylglutaryl-CoA lyase